MSNIKPAFNITLERIQSYGSKKSHFIMVGGPSGEYAKVDEKDRVFIPDRQQKVIHVFDADGNYLTHMGKEGKGPGEFISITSVRIGPKYLYTYDSELKRICAFSLNSLSYSHTLNLDPADWKHIKKLADSNSGTNFFVNGDGGILMGFTPMISAIKNQEANKRTNYHQYYWMKQSGKIVDNEVLRQSARKWITDIAKNGPFKGPTAYRLIFFAEPLIAVTSDGLIYSAWSENFVIEVRDSTGTLGNTITYPFKKAPLKREELIEHYDRFSYEIPQLTKVKEMDLPLTWPALSSLQVDDEDRLWVETIKKSAKGNEWWVLDKQGKLLARFSFDKPIQDIQDGFLYTSERDEKGIARIVQYKFNLD